MPSNNGIKWLGVQNRAREHSRICSYKPKDKSNSDHDYDLNNSIGKQICSSRLKNEKAMHTHTHT